MNNLFLIVFVSIAFVSYGQETTVISTKMEEFYSKTGVIIKVEEFVLPDIKLVYGAVTTKIRKITSEGHVIYFYQIYNDDKTSDIIGSIAYEDLIEINKAIFTLKTNSIEDYNSKSEYLENKFVTEDGFTVGYYVSKGKLKWFLTLNKFRSSNTIFVKDIQTIENAFFEAKVKIDMLKQE